MTETYECDECQRHFKSLPALNGHIRWHRRQQPVVMKGERQHCPVCGTMCLIYPDMAADRLTCCNTCFALYQIGDGRLEREPPEFCAREEAGMECNQPIHKYWYKKYQELKVTQATLGV